MDEATANARRKYHHVHNGGKLTESDVAGMVRVMEDKDVTIARLTAERDELSLMLADAYGAPVEASELFKQRLEHEARASAAAAYERAASITVRQFDSFGDGFDRPLPTDAQETIRALATEAETDALAEIVKKAVEEETRACADELPNCAACGGSAAILARLDQRKEAGE